MNFIRINKLDDFKIILNSDLYITNNDLFKNEEAIENMMCLSIFDIKSAQISNLDILNFIKQLIELRKQQVEKNIIIAPVTFYIWVDTLASQLRFSFISGCGINLPFGCKLTHMKLLSEVIDIFFNLTMGVEENVENDIEDDFCLKVFIECLNEKN